MAQFQRTLRGLAFLASLGLAAWGPAVPPLPPTPKQPVTTEYHGVKVVDDYRWLENSKDPKVQSWVAAEDSHARTLLDSSPDYPKVEHWLEELDQHRSPDFYEFTGRAPVIFALESQPPKPQPLLVSFNAGDLRPEAAHVILDPSTLDAKGATAIDFYVPSVDGKLVAVSLAEGGSENGTVHVYDVQTGRALPDVIPGVEFPTAGGSLAWNADSSGFYYTRYPQGKERPPEDVHFYQQIYFHKLGTPPTDDKYEIGKEFPRIAETTLSASPDGKWVLATVENGDGGDYQHFLRDQAGKWTQLTHYDDKISAVGFGQDDSLYMVSRKNAPRGRMLRVQPTTPNLSKAQTIIPESDAVIHGFRFSIAGFYPDFVAWEGRLYVAYTVGGPTEVRVFDYQGHRLKDLPILPVSTVSQMVPIKTHLFFRNTSYLVPPAWYHFNSVTGGVEETKLRVTSPVNFEDAEVVRDFATSKDGTKVPLNIVRHKGTKLDGNNPAILTGYGGFGLSLSPSFDPTVRMWLDAGGVYAIANLRGGGEFGEAWHEAGMLTHKQNVFDDFIACAQHLIQQRYTNPLKLGIEGGSNGGLLMAAAFTQHPELFRAVVSIAGVYDMLRMEQSANGQYNTTEFGSVKNPEQFRAMYAYSPYQHVRDGTKYPAILFIVGENDMRVESWQSRKMAARLQAANASNFPIVLVSFSGAGHGGIGAARKQRIAMSAYAWSFLFDQLGVNFQTAPPKNSPM